MEATTLTPEMEEYYADLKKHKDYMTDIKPKREKFSDDNAFNKAMSEWSMANFCDAPNKPGYCRANND